MKTNMKIRIPSLRRCNNRGFVELNGRRIYLGAWGAPETQEAYERAISEWLANKMVVPVSKDEITITEVCRDYLLYADEYFRKPDGGHSSSWTILKQACKPLNELYGRTLAKDFAPLALRGIRDDWVERGLARKTVNKYVSQIKKLFKWAASVQKVDISVYQSICTIENLKLGRSSARETDPVRPVPESHIDAIEPYVSRQIWALVQLQLLSGARAGELLKVRPCDMNVSEDVWTLELKDHKTSYRKKKRIIYFGGNAQSILKDFMGSAGIQDYLFSPKTAEQERHAKAGTHRRPNQPISTKSTSRVIREAYTTDTYRRAITRACRKAEVHQIDSDTTLRHSYVGNTD